NPEGFPVTVSDVGVLGVPWLTVNHGTVGGATEMPTVPGLLVTATVACIGPPLRAAFRKTVDGLSATVFCACREPTQTSSNTSSIVAQARPAEERRDESRNGRHEWLRLMKYDLSMVLKRSPLAARFVPVSETLPKIDKRVPDAASG